MKIDVLGVRMQSAMAHAVTEIRRTTGRHLDLGSPDHVDLDDPATFELIRSANVIGCFQIESPGQQDLISRLQPRHMQDVIADICFFSPGADLFPQRSWPPQVVSLCAGTEPLARVPLRRTIVSDSARVVWWRSCLVELGGYGARYGQEASRVVISMLSADTAMQQVRVAGPDLR